MQFLVRIGVFAALLLSMHGCSDRDIEYIEAVDPPDTADNSRLASQTGAPLFEGMGSFEMPISTGSPNAQRYFNQGMVLAFAFNHAESIRSFRAAQILDPNCAMCYWGEALATGPNINVTSNGKVIMSAADRRAAFDALSKALALKDGATRREHDYILALESRYNGDPDTPREPLDLAWAASLKKLVTNYPDDMTAAALYAEALMNTMPWDYWSDNGIAKPETTAVIESLERVLEVEPDHPLALHLYIHALEASNDPSRAEAAADRLLGLVPGAGHLVHMPSHIYYRVGRYADAAEANIAAAAVDEAYIAACNAQGLYPAAYYPHNIHFLWSASTMQGQSELSIESARRVVANVPIEQVKAFPFLEFYRTVPLLSLVRFGRWDEILSEPQPHQDFNFSKAIWHYARGVAFAAKKNIPAAQEELAALTPIGNDVSVQFLDSANYPASSLIAIAGYLLQGEIAYRDGDFLTAATEFEKAVRKQDSLPYTEPPFWYYPTRQSLGAALLSAGDAAGAEEVFRKDLDLYPHNGWSMFGMVQSLTAQDKNEQAAEFRQHFEMAWQFSDVTLEAAIF